MRRALLLDKDGVINIDHGYVCSAERTEFIGGIFDLCGMASRLGYLVVLVTNQAGIGRGYYTEDDFHAYMRWLRTEFQKRGTQIDAVKYCPHHPVHGRGAYRCVCACRKPAPGMIIEARDEFDLDLAHSILVGDKASDLEAGQRAGVGTRIQALLANREETSAVALARDCQVAIRHALEANAGVRARTPGQGQP